MTIWRVYDNGKPFQSANFLPFSTTGVKEGDAVFTSGHPGATQRLNTVAHLEFLRDAALPLSLDAFTAIRNSLNIYMQQGTEQKRQGNDDFFGIQELFVDKAIGSRRRCLRRAILLNIQEQNPVLIRTSRVDGIGEALSGPTHWHDTARRHLI